MPLELCKTEKDTDFYSVSLHLAALCGDEPSGLFFFDILLCRGNEKLYLNPVNNIDFTLSETAPENQFALLVYADGYQTPAWAKNAIMYHIFVDRFAKSEKHSLPVRADARINPDWDNGIPEYAPYPGAHLQNNEFFGGNLYGIIEKLDYLASLGVNVLYLSPIFKAYSNHKYDTGDYAEIDEMFGGKEAFDELLREAAKRSIHVILDGVFNHTGDDSRYFNRYGLDSVGAYQSPDSHTTIGISSGIFRRIMTVGGALRFSQSSTMKTRLHAIIFWAKTGSCAAMWRKAFPVGGWMSPMNCRMRFSPICVMP